MIDSRIFIEALRARNFSQFVGVPCSYLKPFINSVIDDTELDYIGAASEGEAVAIAMGAWLAGRKTVTMCQNSGLGNMVNPLTSLNFPFKIPTLLIVTWRGKPGEADEPQHEQMGEITPDLLNVLGIPWSLFPQSETEVDSILARADEYMEKESRPFALIMPNGSVSKYELRTVSPTKQLHVAKPIEYADSRDNKLTRTQAIKVILDCSPPDQAVIATTGKTGRELFTISDSPSNIYVVGGMGTAAGIGLGIAQTKPKQPVLVLDGDGASLMKLGTLATIGNRQPENLLHIILDNEQHDSTGGQATVSATVRFAHVAAAANYRNAAFAVSESDIRQAIGRLNSAKGPSMLHIKIKPGSPKDLGRPAISPFEVGRRFKAFLMSDNR